MYDRIISDAIHQVKYGRFSLVENSPRWPEARKSIQEELEEIPISEKDLKVILEVVVEKIFDEVDSRISNLRIQ